MAPVLSNSSSSSTKLNNTDAGYGGSTFLTGPHKFEDFVWPQDQQPGLPLNPPLHSDPFPEIDLSLPAPQLVNQIHSACLEWGFFRILNHGVPQSLLDKVFSHSHRFFQLPLERKLTVLKTSSLPSGYTGSSQNVTIRSWNEALNLMPGAKRMNDVVAKIWPCEEERQGASADLEEYATLMGKLAHQMLELLFLGLNVNPAEATKHFGPDSSSTLRINYYPPYPQPNLTFGIPPHRDFGAVTILCEDDVGGLEVFKDERWIGVKPKRSSLIVNVGDIIQVLSNSRYESVLHRTVVNSCESRISLAFFYNPCEGALIAPLPELVTDEYPAKYRDFLWEDYRSTFPKAKVGNHSPTCFFETGTAITTQ